MLPDFDSQALNIVTETRLPDTHAHTQKTPKLRHRICCRLGILLIALGERLTAVAPVTPSATDLELA
jgi:hypothetical protein